MSQPPYNYTVQWFAVKGGILGAITNVTVSVTSYHISGLAPYTKYVISVAVKDWNETGRFSDPLCVHTLEGGKCNEQKSRYYSWELVYNLGPLHLCSSSHFDFRFVSASSQNNRKS